MGISYVGNCEFKETKDFTLSQDLFGLDRLSRTWEGRTDKLAAFLAANPVNSTDTIFRQLKLQSRVSTGDGAFTRVTMEYVGLFSDQLPPAQKRGSIRRQTASIVLDTGDRVADVDYYAPVTTITYLARKEPKGPRFTGYLAQVDFEWEIIEKRNAGGFPFHQVPILGNIGGQQIYGSIQLGAYNYVRQITTPVIDFEKFGDYWTCTEQNEGRIMNLATEDLPFRLQGLTFQY